MPEEGYQRHVNKHTSAGSFLSELTYGLKERKTFDIAYGTSDFHHNYVGIFCFVKSDSSLDFVCYVRNYLNGLPTVNALALI